MAGCARALGVALAAALCGVPACVAAAGAGPRAGIATIVDVGAVLVRGADRFAIAEGLALKPEDILETGENAFLRVELDDRGAIELGPSTRVLLLTRAARAPRLAYLLQGWIKVASGDARAAAFRGVGAPGVDVAELAGTLVLQAGGDGLSAFVERGEARAVEQRAAGAPVPHPLRAGGFLTRPAGAKATRAERPSEAFLRALPPPFRDTLPELAGRFAGRTMAPKPLPALRYEEAEPWLVSEPSLRREFVRRWRARASDPAFRASLVANLRAHPEWEPVLFPERFEARDGAAGYASGRAGSSGGAVAR